MGTTSGEQAGDRAAIDRTADRMIRDGVPKKVAHKKAVESMRRVDRRLRELGKR